MLAPFLFGDIGLYWYGMLRLSKQSDYATVLLSHLANTQGRICNVSELSQATHVSSPMVSKTLKILARAGLVDSERGSGGGYRLNRQPRDISIADIINAVEGPIAVTQCSSQDGCSIQSHCQIRPHWQVINSTIINSLKQLNLAQLLQPAAQLRN
ncbi:MAG: SUF system Fe-S cluster assembly regulator [Oceanococcus sp.]